MVLVTIPAAATGIYFCGYQDLVVCLLGLGWFALPILALILSSWYGDHPSADKLSAFQDATTSWSRTARPFNAHKRAIRPWIRMSGVDFEKAVARILKVRGIDARPTKASGDGGVDIEVFADDHLRMVIQCKRYKSACGPSIVRELYGAMQHHHAPQAMLICLGGFSRRARDFAAGKPIELVDSEMLIEFRNGRADHLFWGLIK